MCGRTEIGEETTCSHEEYQEVYAYTVGKESEGHNLLKVCNSCDYVELVSNSNEPHEFNASGYCGKCGYNPNSSNNSKPSVSGNSVPKQETPSTPTYTEEEIAVQKAEAIAKVTEELIKAEEAIPVTDFVSTEAVNAIPTELKENASTEAVFNVSKITTTRGFVAAVDKIVKDNAKERTVTLYSDKPFAFNATSLTAVADTSKDFVYMFKHEGQLYKVTIPAGAKVDLEGQMFAGPLFIGAKLGT